MEELIGSKGKLVRFFFHLNEITGGKAIDCRGFCQSIFLRSLFCARIKAVFDFITKLYANRN